MAIQIKGSPIIGDKYETYFLSLISVKTGNHRKFYLVLRDLDTNQCVRTWGKLPQSVSPMDIIQKAKEGQRVQGVATNAFFTETISPYSWDKYFRKHIESRIDDPKGKYTKRDGKPYSLLDVATKEDIKAVAMALPATSNNNGNDGGVQVVPQLQAPVLEPEVRQFLSLINDGTSTSIKKQYNGSVAALKPIVLDKANSTLLNIRNVISTQWEDNSWANLTSANRDSLVDWVEEWYSHIPSGNVDTRNGTEGMVSQFMVGMDDGLQEDLLQQLDMAIKLEARKHAGIQAQVPIQKDELVRLYEELGVVLLPIPRGHDIWNAVESYMRKPTEGRRGYSVQNKIAQIFAVEIPHERARYEAETFGADNVLALWHSTAFGNTTPILKTGLKIMHTATNGRRFGNGTYLSRDAYRSAQYMHSWRGYSVMLLNHAKVGTPLRDDTKDYGMDFNKIKRLGKNSVWAKGEWGNRGDEWILYQESQSSIAYVILLND